MSEQEEPNELQPFIVIRRATGQHDEHHGGVWKIAFADFMTAMMAFFLVMWLVNAANEETKAQVASYFNPIKLTDTRAVPKGVRGDGPQVEQQNVDDGAGASEDINKKAAEPEGAPAQSEADTKQENAENMPFNEEALFKDPYAVLAEIAGDAGQGEPVLAAVPPGRTDAGLSGGDAFRDPFDPAFWQHGPGFANRKPQEEVEGIGAFEMAEVREFLEEGGDDTASKSGEADERRSQTVADMVQVRPPHDETLAVVAPAKDTARPEKPAVPVQEAAEQDMPSHDAETAGQARARHVEAELAKIISQSELARGPQISVESTGEGVLVRLTDGQDFSMFSLSSAQPSRDMVRMMDKVAGVLKRTKGNIIIRGHTDARPFRSENYDNWRLSTARAHMAYHMLVRGGIGKARFVRIEGRADRDLKVKSDPEAAQNRRIEILLEGPA